MLGGARVGVRAEWGWRGLQREGGGGGRWSRGELRVSVCVFASRNQGSYAPFLVGVRLFPIKPA